MIKLMLVAIALFITACGGSDDSNSKGAGGTGGNNVQTNAVFIDVSATSSEAIISGVAVVEVCGQPETQEVMYFEGGTVALSSVIDGSELCVRVTTNTLDENESVVSETFDVVVGADQAGIVYINGLQLLQTKMANEYPQEFSPTWLQELIGKPLDTLTDAEANAVNDAMLDVLSNYSPFYSSLTLSDGVEWMATLFSDGQFLNEEGSVSLSTLLSEIAQQLSRDDDTVVSLATAIATIDSATYNITPLSAVADNTLPIEIGDNYLLSGSKEIQFPAEFFIGYEYIVVEVNGATYDVSPATPFIIDTTTLANGDIPISIIKTAYDGTVDTQLATMQVENSIPVINIDVAESINSPGITYLSVGEEESIASVVINGNIIPVSADDNIAVPTEWLVSNDMIPIVFVNADGSRTESTFPFSIAPTGPQITTVENAGTIANGDTVVAAPLSEILNTDKVLVLDSGAEPPSLAFDPIIAENATVYITYEGVTYEYQYRITQDQFALEFSDEWLPKGYIDPSSAVPVDIEIVFSNPLAVDTTYSAQFNYANDPRLEPATFLADKANNDIYVYEWDDDGVKKLYRTCQTDINGSCAVALDPRKSYIAEQWDVVNGEPALTTTYISPAQSTINFDAIDHIFATVVADELARGVGTENAELSADEYMQENFGISYLNTEATKPISGDPLTENNKRWLITEALNNLDSEAELDLWVTQIQQKTDASEEMLNTLVENVLQVSQGAGYDSPNDEADTITFAGDLDKSIGPDEVKFIYYNKGNVLTGSEWSVQSVTDISVKVIGDYDLGSTQVFINGELITREIINGILEITNEIEVGVYVLTFSHKIDDDIVEIVNKRIYIDSSEPTVNMSFLMPVNYIDDNNYLKNASLETVVENKNTILLQNNHSSIDITNGIDVVASRIPQIRYRVFDNDEIITHEVIVDNKQGTVITYDAVLLDSPFNDYVIAINELFLNRDSTPINRSTTYDITIRIVDKALNTMIETTSVTVISHEVVTKTESKHIDTSQYNFDNRLSLRSEVLEASRHMIGNDSGEDLYLKIDQSGNETNPLLQTYNEAIRVNYARLSRSTKEFRTRRASSYSCDATWGNYFSVSTIYKWGYSDDPSETGLGWGAMRATSVPLSDDESSTYRYVSDDTHSGTWVNIAPNATRDYDLVTDPRNRATAGYIRCPNGNINHAQIRQGYAYASASGYPRNETTNGVRETSMPQPDFKLVDSISLQELGKNSRNEYILETGKSAILLHNQSVPAYPVFNIADVADIDTFRRYVTSRLDSLVYMLLDNTVDLAIRDGQTGNTYKQNITETVTPFIIERPENWQAP